MKHVVRIKSIFYYAVSYRYLQSYAPDGEHWTSLFGLDISQVNYTERLATDLVEEWTEGLERMEKQVKDKEVRYSYDIVQLFDLP
jgi:hypothetical protein